MTIYGWDMSHYDAPNIGTAVQEGYRFITHKAGGDATDQELDDWWTNVNGLGSDVVLGAYWVQYPGSPAARADRFLERLDTVCKGWRARDSFILQVDCEKWGGDPSTVPSKAEIQEFCNRLVTKTSGVYRPVVYAPKWLYGETLKGLGFPLWASSYVTGTGTGPDLYASAGGDQSSRWNAYSGRTPDILQFTSSATIAGQTTCDANAFRGTLAQLKSLVTPGSVAPPAPGRKTMNLQVKIPVLRQGDEDDKLPGYNLIARIQRIVGAKDDGNWGPKTTAEIADWCNLPEDKCRTLTEDIYRKVFGAAR